jgi:hypothetical protein
MRVLTTASLLFVIASLATAQNQFSNQNTGDIVGDCTTINNPSTGSGTLISPFNYGLVQAPTGVMLGIVPVNYANASREYVPGIFTGAYSYSSTNSYDSNFVWNLTGTSQSPYGVPLPPNSVTMYASQLIPCVEAKIPKGTYTFQATATPLEGSGNGFFQFQTYSSGQWTVQFSLALPKPEGATRTITFATDARVRWMLVPNSGSTMYAAITAKYYNSGS